MNKHLRQLIDLSDLDKTIDDFLPEEERINGALNALLDEQNRAKRQIEETESIIVENRAKIAKHEAHLAEQSVKLAQHAKKSGDLKSEREVKALSLEEDIAREQVTFINEEIARIQKDEGDQKARIDKLKTRIIEIESQVGESRKQNADALAELGKRRDAVVAERDKLVAEIPQKVFGFYAKIRRWAGDRVVVPVKKQACYGCFMKISDKVYSEVIASQEIVTCPSCGCILYVKEDEKSEDKKDAA
ncbi:MAG: C4-type zinc ribbon domain-containing protein [Helicobacteraceae bacterium]|jgi:predicted  nucleic acid-binding Zn-ribbon protein|nr:C4-type zinc ribbon domain-containing protein [Helicobacteraceae bacterium]